MNLQVMVDFQVLDESADWIVVDKPAPLIVHPANRQSEPTLLGGLEQLLAYELATGGDLGIVTRLDRETSGVVLISKHKAAARELGWIFERRQARKEYLAIVNGWPVLDEWLCEEGIIRAGELGPSKIWVRQVVSERGKDCRTRFRVERRFEREEGRFSVIRCFPETGRMHQIRVHLASGGFPIVGDKLYSRNGAEYLEWMEQGWTPSLQERLILPRHALHAAGLAISWFGVEYRWKAEMGGDLEAFCEGEVVTLSDKVVIWNRGE
jgi:23S rRNA pseudouridine1911/1915/1917 synthase